jgi:hypothetical protein
VRTGRAYLIIMRGKSGAQAHHLTKRIVLATAVMPTP